MKVKKEIVEFKRDEFPKAGVTADMSHEDICAALISTFTSSDFSVDGLTGSGMTWAATGEISKAPLVFEVQDGVYVAR